MKILLCIPIIVNPVVAREAINQVINKENVTVILCNNGGGQEIDNLLSEFQHTNGVRLWRRDVNTFVNPIWNDFIEYFLTMREWDKLIIMNSDLTLQQNWDQIIKNRWYLNPDEVIVTNVSDDKTRMYQPQPVEVDGSTQLYTGIPGIFITLNQRQAEMVAPIPDEIKIWFGDTWVYNKLVYLGERIIVPWNLWAFHHHSTSVQKVPGVYEMIEEDKIVWRDVVEPRLVAEIQEAKLQEAKK